ncbi:effector-binding domain-containing protein [Rhodopseudomonas rhenobacensis]|uniref:Effector-binding domain-containing protein n=1 Tax=Rhodopseudomonas rhenobacensis TaxID=87461 RepID=A0A7W7Z6M6_9BRAD|nr:heme-binding protein [Rhodopseudomonas rhenobacensis]MBB5048929.1 effector-binding domain-containing protein [Rhodopseudomonas rhenobacensis]
MLQSVLNFLQSVVFGMISIFGINLGTEQPRYDVIARIGDSIEIRHYPARLAAETTVQGSSSNARGEAFRLVAGYIFGANNGKQKIAMTSPVEVSSPGSKIAMTVPVEVGKADDGLVMRFFMPSEYSREQLPDPSDPRVKLVERPASTVAALRFSGSTGDAAVAARTAELTHALAATDWRAAGEVTALFYNPPWTLPFLRRNEVVVPLTAPSAPR